MPLPRCTPSWAPSQGLGVQEYTASCAAVPGAQVGSYAFTTLHPQLGAIPNASTGGFLEGNAGMGSAPGDQGAGMRGEGGRALASEQPLVLADIPGLISGAHKDRRVWGRVSGVGRGRKGCVCLCACLCVQGVYVCVCMCVCVCMRVCGA